MYLADFKRDGMDDGTCSELSDTTNWKILEANSMTQRSLQGSKLQVFQVDGEVDGIEFQEAGGAEMKAERSHLALGQCILCTNREVYLWHRLSQAQRTRPSVGSAAHRSVQKRASIGGAPACLFTR